MLIRFFNEFLTNFEWREQLRQADDKEKQVEKEFELMKKYYRNESYGIVLCVIYLVMHMPLRLVASSIHVYGSRLIYH